MVELRETAVDVLIRRRLLAAESRHDKAAVRHALYQSSMPRFSDP
jgi:hypothetical protein